jgi:hypothetical protein
MCHPEPALGILSPQEKDLGPAFPLSSATLSVISASATTGTDARTQCTQCPGSVAACEAEITRFRKR